MKITKYGVTLNRLTQDKIEMVRQWRNNPKISQFMEYRENITFEMQQKWFEEINNDNNYYFIIEYENKEVGLVNVKNIDYKEKEGEAGIFIYDDSLLNSTISFQAILCLYDFCFETLNLDKMIAHTFRNNKRAIKFNKIFGYQISENQERIENQMYILRKKEYFENRSYISLNLE